MKYSTRKERRFKKVYEMCADEVYRVCLYFMRDEKEAQRIAEQAFVEFYDEFEDIDPKYWKAYLVCKARDLAKFDVTKRLR